MRCALSAPRPRNAAPLTHCRDSVGKLSRRVSTLQGRLPTGGDFMPRRPNLMASKTGPFFWVSLDLACQVEWTNVFASGLTSSLWRFCFTVRIHNPPPMSNSHSTSFDCPNCAAKYEVVRVEAPQGPTVDREITCVSCGGPLHGREGRFLLKYFMVERPKRRAAGRG
jgi:hypothetical protein